MYVYCIHIVDLLSFFNTTNMPFETGSVRKILQEVCVEFKILGIRE